MPSLSRLRIAARAAAHVPPRALLHHLRRRLRARLIPRREAAYTAMLEREAAALPPAATDPSLPARVAAETVAAFFAAKHAKNAGQCLDGRFTFLNRTHDFGGADRIDWRVDMDGGRYQLWRANLAFMGYLATAADADPAAGLALAATLARSFRAHARFDRPSVFSDAWNSYPASQRVLALSTLLIRLPAALADAPDRAEVDGFLRFNVAFLLRNLETELGYNHLERNLSALALHALAAGTVAPAIRRALLAHFDHVVGETIGADGVQAERSPMYQGLTIQSLRVFAALDVWSGPQAALIARRLAAAEDALAATTLGDDRPSMMNDGWFDEAPRPSAILGGRPAPGFVALRDAGYVRLAGAGAVALFDAGPIGPDANPGHGHPDFLSVEMSLGDARLIVDPGTGGYSADAARAADRRWDRHNGPSIEGGAPVEYTGSFKVGRRAAATLDAAAETADGQRAAGRLAFRDAEVTRAVRLAGATLTIEDRWVRGRGRRQSRFLVPATWAPTRDGDAVLLASGPHRVRIAVADATLAVEADHYSCRYNETEPAHALVVRPARDRATITIAWG